MRIRRAARDVRVLRGARAAWQPVTGVAVFAAALYARHVGRRPPWPALTLTLHQSPVGPSPSPPPQVALNFRSRLALTVLQQLPRAAVTPSRAAPQRETVSPALPAPAQLLPLPPLRLHSVRTLWRETERRLATTVRVRRLDPHHHFTRAEVQRRERLTQWLVQRAQRVEPGAPSQRLRAATARAQDPASPAAAPSLPPLTPPPQIVHRPRQPAVPASEPAARNGPQEPGRTSAFRPSPAGANMPAPQQAALDIRRLTDQVVRNIDQRMIAYRERMGKV